MTSEISTRQSAYSFNFFLIFFSKTSHHTVVIVVVVVYFIDKILHIVDRDSYTNRPHLASVGKHLSSISTVSVVSLGLVSWLFL